MISPKWRPNKKNAPSSEMSTKWQQMGKYRQNVDDCLKIPYVELIAPKASCVSRENVNFVSKKDVALLSLKIIVHAILFNSKPFSALIML